jgi:hypothetical protein
MINHPEGKIWRKKEKQERKKKEERKGDLKFSEVTALMYFRSWLSGRGWL